MCTVAYCALVRGGTCSFDVTWIEVDLKVAAFPKYDVTSARSKSRTCLQSALGSALGSQADTMLIMATEAKK